MNKLFTKIVGVALGLTMAIGVGVAVANSDGKKAILAEAATNKSYNLDFATIGTTGWSATYSDHDNVVNDSSCSISLKSAIKQNSGATIEDYPVTKAGDTIVVLKETNAVMSSVTFTLLQWSNYAKTVTLQYSSNGGTSYSNLSPSVTSSVTDSTTSSSFTLTSSNLPSGTNAVKMVQGNTSKQVGLVSIAFTYSIVSTTFTVTYNANGGTGTVPTDSNSYTSGASVTVKGNTGNLAKDGYEFDGWNTAANGSGTTRGVGSRFIISGNTTLYARWVLPTSTTQISLDFTSSTYGLTTTQSETQVFTGDAEIYGFVSAGGSGCKVSAASPSSTSYFMMGKTGAYLKNTAVPTDKYISNISFNYSSGVSTAVVLSISFGSTELNAPVASGDNLHTLSAAVQGGSDEVNNSNENNGYFYIYVTNSNNVQFKDITITWTRKTVVATGVSISLGSSSDSTLTNKVVTLEKDSGTNSVYTEDLVATVTPNNSTDSTVTWSKGGTNASYVDLDGALIDDGNNEIMFEIATDTIGTFTISASADGGTSVIDTITYTIIDSSLAPLTGVTVEVTGSIKVSQYAGNAFDATGFTFTANHSTDSSQDYVIESGITWDTLAKDEHPEGHYTENGVTIDFYVTQITALPANTFNIVDGGQYRIYHIYDDVKYYLMPDPSAPSSSSPKFTTNSWEANVYTFALVDNDTFTIKLDGDYLYTINDNNGMKFSSSAKTGNEWKLTSGTYWNGTSVTSASNGFYNVMDTTNSRYISAYINENAVVDFRAYKFNAPSGDVPKTYNSGRTSATGIELYDETAFAGDVINATDTVCSTNEAHSSSNFTTLWGELETDYGRLTAISKGNFVSAVADENGTTLQKGAARYDRVCSKYGLKNFATGRTPASANPNIILTAFRVKASGSAISIIVIALVGITTVGGYFFLRKRKEQ